MKYVPFLISIFFSCLIFSQSAYTSEDFDYLNYNYKNLNKDFKITISSEAFNETIEQYKFISERIKTYKDSLNVVLMHEFNDWSKMRMASLRITYSWERVGFHLWKNENEINTLANTLNIKRPYELQQLLYNPKGNKRLITIIEELKETLKKEFPNEDFNSLTNAKLMKFAFKNNPEVLKLKKAYFDSRHKKN